MYYFTTSCNYPYVHFIAVDMFKEEMTHYSTDTEVCILISLSLCVMIIDMATIALYTNSILSLLLVTIYPVVYQ